MVCGIFQHIVGPFLKGFNEALNQSVSLSALLGAQLCPGWAWGPREVKETVP